MSVTADKKINWFGYSNWSELYNNAALVPREQLEQRFRDLKIDDFINTDHLLKKGLIKYLYLTGYMGPQTMEYTIENDDVTELGLEHLQYNNSKPHTAAPPWLKFTKIINVVQVIEKRNKLIDQLRREIDAINANPQRVINQFNNETIMESSGLIDTGSSSSQWSLPWRPWRPNKQRPQFSLFSDSIA